MTGTVHVDTSGDVSLVRIDDGKVNAMDSALLGAIQSGVREAVSAGKPVALAGNDKAFSAGLNLRKVPELDRDGMVELMVALHGMVGEVLRARVPVVAAVTGAAVAGGAVLALSCDHRVGRPGAEIGATENAVGVPFPPPLVPLLRDRLGPRTLQGTVFLARRVSGDDAVEKGWLDEVSTEPVARAKEVAVELSGPNPEAFWQLKRGRNKPILVEWPDDASAWRPGGPHADYVDGFYADGAMERIRAGIMKALSR